MIFQYSIPELAEAISNMRKFNLYYVLHSIGLILMIESVFMLVSAFVGEYYTEPSVRSLYQSTLITFFSGLAMYVSGKKEKRKQRISKREIYLTVTLVWVAMALFGTLPFLLGGAFYNFTDAFFESMCGFTTTGSSTLLNIEAFPKSLHFWRSFTQWIGGIGILIFVMSFLPLFGDNGSSLYSAEATGISEDQFRLRVSDIVRKMALTYVGITAIGIVLLSMGPMNVFDAACHTFSAISTGGFSTKQASIAHFNSAYTEYVIIGLMFLGGTNFMLTYNLFARSSTRIFKDEEFRWYVGMILLFTLIISVTLIATHIMTGNLENTLRTVLFQVVAAVTSSGYATVNFLSWGQFYWFLFLAMVLFCGSEGSTSGGMKVSRLIVLVKNTAVVFKRQVHPQALYMVKMNGKVISNNTVDKVLAFVFLYITILGISSIILSYTGMTFDEAIGTSVSAISSYGFGLGDFGPAGNFSSATDFAKYYLCFLMLVGRLEIFTVLSLFVPSFWKR